MQKRVHRRGGTALQSITPVRGEGVGQRANNQKRKWNKREQRQLRVEIKHHAEHDEHLQDRDQTLLDPVDQDPLD